MELVKAPPVCSLQVNGTDVVKVGHRQVVSLIRQGGSRLLMKVVSVSRKSETNLIRKKGGAVHTSLVTVHLKYRTEHLIH